MRWSFWPSPKQYTESEGLKDAKDRVKEADKQRYEVDKLMDRHRKIREANHLGQAAIASMQRKRPT